MHVLHQTKEKAERVLGQVLAEFAFSVGSYLVIQYHGTLITIKIKMNLFYKPILQNSFEQEINALPSGNCRENMGMWSTITWFGIYV